MFGFFKKKRSPLKTGERIYAVLAAQARHPSLYTRYGVPDTMEARFELLILHLFVVLQWFQSDKEEPIRQVMQELCDHFFTEMDRAMRETGVGDLAVPKRIKKMAQHYVTRTTEYDAATAQSDREPFFRLLALHIFGDESHIERAKELADYVEVLRVALSMEEPLDTLENFWLPSPDEAALTQ